MCYLGRVVTCVLEILLFCLSIRDIRVSSKPDNFRNRFFFLAHKHHCFILIESDILLLPSIGVLSHPELHIHAYLVQNRLKGQARTECKSEVPFCEI